MRRGLSDECHVDLVRFGDVEVVLVIGLMRLEEEHVFGGPARLNEGRRLDYQTSKLSVTSMGHESSRWSSSQLSIGDA